MAALEKISSFFGISDSSAEDEYASEESTASSQNEVEIPTEIADHLNNKGRNNVVSIKSGNMPQSKIVLYEPRVYSDAKEVAQNLLSNKAVIINFSRMDDDSARRIVDFITGTVYALNGEIQRVGDKIFLATPPKFETDGKITELVEKKDKLS